MVNFRGWWERTGLTNMRNSPIVQKTIGPMRAYAREAHVKNESRLAAARQAATEIGRHEQFEAQRTAAIIAEEKRIGKALKDAGDEAGKLGTSTAAAVTKLKRVLAILPQLNITTIRRGATAKAPGGGKAEIVSLQHGIRLEIGGILGNIKVAYDAEADEEKITSFLGDVEARLVQSKGIIESSEAKVTADDAKFEAGVKAIVKELNAAIRKLRKVTRSRIPAGRDKAADVAKLSAHVAAIEAQLVKLRSEVKTILAQIKIHETQIARDEIKMVSLNADAGEVISKVKDGNYKMYSAVRTASSLVEYNRIAQCQASVNTAIRLATEVGSLGKRLGSIVTAADNLCKVVQKYATKLVSLEKNLQIKISTEYAALAGLIASADAEMSSILSTYP